MKIDFSPFEQITTDEPLCRYLTSSSHFSQQNNRVKYSAFMPPSNLKLSIFRIVGLEENEIWEMGKKNISDKNLHGRAEISPMDINKAGLKIDPDNIPERHANIIGWPDEKSARQMAAIELASKASLKLIK
ncbi:hypothetical protein HY745_08300 [Candidatus Desantisbacteria bacterium]|nr:hypothetical protein [Candidatus Desantisbacteria bacterium]